jgi:hypothetical protein
MITLRLAGLLLYLTLSWPAAAAAQTGAGQPPPAQPASQQSLVDLTRAMVQTSTISAPPATLSFNNRTIVEFHATVLGRTPAMRATAVERLLRELVDQGQPGRVSVRPIEQVIVLSAGTFHVRAVCPGAGGWRSPGT